MKSQGKINKQKKKAFIGLSGGVDSAVSAALLKERGFDVTGVFIKAWTPPGYPCTWREDRRSAMRACAVLDIPFLTLDLEREYKQKVVDYMINEYKSGRTPNPDVMCNKKIKFGVFLKFALDQGADYIATGHYARVFPSPAQEKGGRPGEVRLKEGIDKSKDQSYFLWTLSQDRLKRILFPVGHLQKEEVRKLAIKFNLPQATRRDSQGLCFLGQIDMKEFLKEFIKTKKGRVLNAKHEVVGEHDSALLYTLGERHGFRIFNQKSESKPLYVVAKNVGKNTITVVPKITPYKTQVQWSSSYLLGQTNWISGQAPEGEVECRFRYRQEKLKCKIIPQKSNGQGASLSVEFSSPQLIASGQSIVFYDGEICLGGGVVL